MMGLCSLEVNCFLSLKGWWGTDVHLSLSLVPWFLFVCLSPGLLLRPGASFYLLFWDLHYVISVYFFRRLYIFIFNCHLPSSLLCVVSVFVPGNSAQCMTALVRWEEGRRECIQAFCKEVWWREMIFHCSQAQRSVTSAEGLWLVCVHLRLLQVWSWLLCRMSPQGGSLGTGCLSPVPSSVMQGDNPSRSSDCCLILLFTNRFDLLFLEIWLRWCGMGNGLFWFCWYKQECSAFPSD